MGSSGTEEESKLRHSEVATKGHSKENKKYGTETKKAISNS